MSQKRLGHHECVFGIVADHSSAEQQPHPPVSAPAFTDPLRRHVFSSKPESISDRSSKQQPLKSCQSAGTGRRLGISCLHKVHQFSTTLRKIFTPTVFISVSDRSASPGFRFTPRQASSIT